MNNLEKINNNYEVIVECGRAGKSGMSHPVGAIKDIWIIKVNPLFEGGETFEFKLKKGKNVISKVDRGINEILKIELDYNKKFQFIHYYNGLANNIMNWETYTCQRLRTDGMWRVEGIIADKDSKFMGWMESARHYQLRQCQKCEVLLNSKQKWLCGECLLEPHGGLNGLEAKV